MRKCLTIVLVASLVLGSTTPSAFAFKEFYDQWIEMYIDDADTSKEATEYSDLVTSKDKCLVCHQGKTKKKHNEYGMHFVGVIDKTHKKDVDKIKQVLKDVGAKKSKPDDSSSKTYDELIKEFKLPGGELADLQKEP
jgi:hypothetical protein